MEYSMYKYILVCTYTCLDVQTKNSMYWYVLVCTDHVTGFRRKHRDAARRSVSCGHSREEGWGAGDPRQTSYTSRQATCPWNSAESQYIPQKTKEKHWRIDAPSKAVESGGNYARGRQFKSYSYAYFSYSFVLAYTVIYWYIQVCTCMNQYISIWIDA